MLIAGITHNRRFARVHPRARSSLIRWEGIISQAAYPHPNALKVDFPHASLVGRFTVFNIGGGLYRLVARINYVNQTVEIVNVLTHPEYDEDRWKNA